MVDYKALVPWRSRSRAPARRDDFYDPFAAFRREIDRMFDDFFHGAGGRALGSPFDPWSGVTPTLDMTETEKELIVTAELPGLDEKDFEVTVCGDVLTLRGEKRAEHEQKGGNAHYVERRFGAFSRSVQLPFEVKEEHVEARYDKGVLTVRLPKPAELQRPGRRIEVRTV